MLSPPLWWLMPLTLLQKKTQPLFQSSWNCSKFAGSQTSRTALSLLAWVTQRPSQKLGSLFPISTASLSTTSSRDSAASWRIHPTPPISQSWPALTNPKHKAPGSRGRKGARPGQARRASGERHQGTSWVTSLAAGKITPDDHTTHREEAISRSFPIKELLIYLQHTRSLDQAKAKLKWQLGD